MYYQFAESCVFPCLVEASKTDPKTVRFSPELVRRHTLLAVNSQDGVVDFSFQSDIPEQERTLDQGKDIRLMALLRPQFKERVSDSELIYAFGVEDGPIVDGEPTTAAEVRLVFSSDGKTPKYTPYDGVKLPVDEQLIDGGWVLTLENGLVAPANSTDCEIVVIPPGPDADIETSVMLHVLNHLGELLCVVEKGNNNKITLRYEPDESLLLLCLIKPNQLSSPPRRGQPGEVIFSIGDPRVDAKVTVTEDDTAADIFIIFSDFFRNLARWFRNLFSA